MKRLDRLIRREVKDSEQPEASSTEKVRRKLYPRARGIDPKRLDKRSSETYAGSSQGHQNEGHQNEGHQQGYGQGGYGQEGYEGGMEMQGVARALSPVEEQLGSASGAVVSYYDSYDSEDGGHYRGGPYMGANDYDSDASYIDSHSLNTHMQDMAERWEKSGRQGGEMALAGLYRMIEELKGRYEYPATQEVAEREGKRLAEYEIECRKEFTAKDKARAAAQKKAHDSKTQNRVKREQAKKSGKQKKGQRY